MKDAVKDAVTVETTTNVDAPPQWNDHLTEMEKMRKPLPPLDLTEEELIAAEIALGEAVRRSERLKRKGPGDVFVSRSTARVLAKVRALLPDSVLDGLGLHRNEHGIVCEG